MRRERVDGWQQGSRHLPLHQNTFHQHTDWFSHLINHDNIALFESHWEDQPLQWPLVPPPLMEFSPRTRGNVHYFTHCPTSVTPTTMRAAPLSHPIFQWRNLILRKLNQFSKGTSLIRSTADASPAHTLSQDTTGTYNLKSKTTKESMGRILESMNLEGGSVDLYSVACWSWRQRAVGIFGPCSYIFYHWHSLKSMVHADNKSKTDFNYVVVFKFATHTAHFCLHCR